MIEFILGLSQTSKQVLIFAAVYNTPQKLDQKIVVNKIE